MNTSPIATIIEIKDHEHDTMKYIYAYHNGEVVSLDIFGESCDYIISRNPEILPSQFGDGFICRFEAHEVRL